MDRIKVGIIGQGRSGHDIHVRALTSMQNTYQVAAVCDVLKDRTRDAESALGARGYTDWREMVARDDLDLIVVAPPSHLHVPMTTAALEAGRNVLCDKPVARRATDVDKLIELSERKKRYLGVFQQSRFGPYFRQVRAVIQSGVLGRIVMIKIAFNGFARRWDWQTLQEFDGGSLLNTGPHPMDQALTLMGVEGMPTVTCVMDRVTTLGDAEDFVKILLRAPGKPLVDLEISSCDVYPRYTYHIHGQYGGLTGDMNTIQWKYYRPAEAPAQKLIREPLEGRQFCSEKLVMREESWTNPHADMYDYMAQAFYQDLHQVLTRGAAPEVPLRDVRRQIAVMEECHRQNPLSRGPDRGP